ncbi:MAG TPA: hypothetical protein VK550_33330 [Polyangiaceae bacterium]|nr:hypothetical protein [Polyangiaceae bacterium]
MKAKRSTGMSTESWGSNLTQSRHYPSTPAIGAFTLTASIPPSRASRDAHLTHADDLIVPRLQHEIRPFIRRNPPVISPIDHRTLLDGLNAILRTRLGRIQLTRQNDLAVPRRKVKVELLMTALDDELEIAHW